MSTTTPAVEPLLYSRKLAAAALCLSVRAIDNLLSRGVFKTVQVGTRRLIPASELKKFARSGFAGDLAPATAPATTPATTEAVA